MEAVVQLGYIPRSGDSEPKVRLTIFREIGSALLDIPYSAISKLRQPASESRDDVLQAFRECVPLFLRSLNRRIAEIPAGEVLFVNGEMLVLLERKELNGIVPILRNDSATAP